MQRRDSGPRPHQPGPRKTRWLRAAAHVVLVAFSVTATHLPWWSAVAQSAPPPEAAPAAAAADSALPGNADTRLRIFVVPFAQAPDASSIAAKRMESQIRGVLSVNDQVHVLADADLVIEPEPQAVAAPQANERIEAADKLLWEGKEQLKEKKAKKASATLKKAADGYRDNYAELVDYDKMVDAYVQLAEAFYRVGAAKNGLQALEVAFGLRPTLTVDKRLQNKKFVAALEKLEAEQGRYKAGTLKVNSSPPGARVFVDGLLRGKAPVEVTGLRKGEHFVQVLLDGYKRYAKVVQAPMGDQMQTIAAILDPDISATDNAEGEYVSPEPLLPYATTGDFGPNFRRAAKRFTEKAKVDAVVYGYVTRYSGEARAAQGGLGSSATTRGYQLHLFLYDSSAAEVAGLDPVTFDSELANAQVKALEAEQRIIITMGAFPTNRIVLDPPPAVYRQIEVAPAAVVAPAAAAPTAAAGVVSVLGDYPTVDENALGTMEVLGEEEDSEEWYEKWWVWTLIGVGVAGAAVGGAAGAGAFESDSGGGSGGFTGSVQLP